MLSGRANINTRFAEITRTEEQVYVTNGRTVYVTNGRPGLCSGADHKKSLDPARISPLIEAICGVDDRVRTGDPQNHNLML
jgi:hypothetical protein